MSPPLTYLKLRSLKKYVTLKQEAELLLKFEFTNDPTGALLLQRPSFFETTISDSERNIHFGFLVKKKYKLKDLSYL